MGSEIFEVQENSCFENFLWKVTNMPPKNKSLLQAPQKSVGLFEQPKNHSEKKPWNIQVDFFSKFDVPQSSDCVGRGKKDILAFTSNSGIPVIGDVCLGVVSGWVAKLNGCKPICDFQIIKGSAFLKKKKLWSGFNWQNT